MIGSFLGIDIAKLTFQVALRTSASEKIKFKSFSNTQSGFEELLSWLTKHQANDLHACMEATGHYGEDLANFLYEKNIKNKCSKSCTD